MCPFSSSGLRACLVRDRVDPGGVNLLLISGRQAAFGPLLWGSYLACRSVSTIESFQIGLPRTLEPTERFDPHPYQTGSKILCTSRRASMQATTATPLAGGRGKFPFSKDSA